MFNRISVYIIAIISLLVLELLYFRIARYYNIVDRPNHRSSHKTFTILGGGIIFPISLFLCGLITGFNYIFFLSGVLLISFVSFYDDLKPLSYRIRLFGHLIAVTFLFVQVDLFAYAILFIVIGYILVIGAINAYNFMDGINGITGVYSLINVISLWYINEWKMHFVDCNWLVFLIVSLCVFNFFNFRRRAICFAGDVGSVSMAFILIYFILLLIVETGNLKYIGLLLVYGLDSVSTIIFRLIRRENIFDAHRSHFYQYLVNGLHWPHLIVSFLYMIIQILLNLFIINNEIDSVQMLIFCLTCGVLFVGIRYFIEGKELLLGDQSKT